MTLTSIQRDTLALLAKRRDAVPDYPYGFKLRYQHRTMGAAARRVLEPKKLVTIDKSDPRRFLYEITQLGRLVLEANK